MKKVFSKLAVLLMIAEMLAGCAQTTNGSGTSETNSESSETIGTDQVKICLYGADAGTVWNVWAWKKGASSDTNYSAKSWPGGDI